MFYIYYILKNLLNHKVINFKNTYIIAIKKIKPNKFVLDNIPIT